MKTFRSTGNLISFILIALYVLVYIINAISSALSFLGLMKTIATLLPALFILCYLLTENKNLKTKKYLFPLSFGIIVFRNLYAVINSFISTPKELLLPDIVKIQFAFTVVLLMFNILCFIGTLFEFKYSLLLKIGCIGYGLTLILMCGYEFISLGGFEYIQNVLDGYTAINISAAFSVIAILFFYTGVFVLKTKEVTE